MNRNYQIFITVLLTFLCVVNLWSAITSAQIGKFGWAVFSLVLAVWMGWSAWRNFKILRGK